MSFDVLAGAVLDACEADWWDGHRCDDPTHVVTYTAHFKVHVAVPPWVDADRMLEAMPTWWNDSLQEADWQGQDEQDEWYVTEVANLGSESVSEAVS